MIDKIKYCTNCGKNGHYHKKCIEPKISLGIIAIYFNNISYYQKKLINKRIKNNYYEIDSFNFLHLNNISKIYQYIDSIKFLMIRRKHSMNYIEFMRGLYDINNILKIGNMFKLMTKKEVIKILTKPFDILWDELWKTTSKVKFYNKEYKKSKNKFNILLKSSSIEYLKNIDILYDEPEWGFPKGRRDGYENDIDCALREFKEETFIELEENDICNNILPIDEIFKGTNGKDYKNIYYLTLKLENTALINDYCIKNHFEVSQIKWLTYREALQKIRPYDHSKISIINKILMLFINLIETNTSNNILFLN